MADSTTTKTGKFKLIYVVTYFFEWLSGIIVYFVVAKDDIRMKRHCVQAIILGIIATVASAVLGVVGSIVALLIWLYGLYIGFQAASGKDEAIPAITDWVNSSVK